MKILFISDIHGIDTYLDIIDNQSFDEIICLGDIGTNEIVDDWLNHYKHKLICLKGNCDYENQNLFTEENTIKFNIDNINIICNHGNKFAYGKKPLLNFDVLIYGHEHIPYIKKVDNQVYICVGSIGKPRNNSKPSYCIYENNSFILKDIENNTIDQISIKKL